MFAYEAPLDPPLDEWMDYQKPIFIRQKIEEICEDIFCRLEKSQFEEIYDLLHEYIEDNLDKFLPQVKYE